MDYFTKLAIILKLIMLVLLMDYSAHAGQDPAMNLLLQETEQDALQRLWNETSAKWEINQERIALFESQQPGKSLKHDDFRVVKLMGFSKRGEPIYYQTYNFVAAQMLNTNQLWSGGLSELQLNGEDIRLHVWDGGSIRHTHQEFDDRTTQMDEPPYMVGHATHVAGTMVSAGINIDAKGMAPAAELHVYDFSNDEGEMIAAAADGAILSNHSYGRPTGWLFNLNQWWWYGDTRISETIDYKFGFYSEETALRDEITYLAPFYLQVHAAGNDRVDFGPEEGEEYNVFDHDLGVWVKSTDYREPDGGEYGYDSTTGLVLGKNVITVGSVADIDVYTGPESVQLSEFSSTGPADDGRIKPDIVANGEGVFSTWVDTNTSYIGLTGTSMAAPTITGSLGLIQQLNKRLYGNYLRAATLKALMIHTAREAGEHPGPDYWHGWGLADMEAAAGILPGKDNTTIIQERNLVQNVVPEYSRTVYANGQQPLVATLVWSDVPGTPLEPALNNRTPMLVNDLDLKLTRLVDGEVFYPWKLDPDNPSAPATTGDNVVDNVEKIELLFPESGEYIIEVSHKGEIVDPINSNNKRQAFSLIISGIAERELDLAITNAIVHDDGCNFSENTPASIMLANFGQQDVFDVFVNYVVKDADGNILQEEVTGVSMLESGTETTLDVLLDLTQGLDFEIVATVNHPGDQLPANNSYTKAVSSINWLVSDESYYTSFEEITMIEAINWQVVNNNEDASSWALRIGTGESQWASDGFNSMRYGKLNPGEDGVETMEEADDWLISTCFYLLESENYRLTFDYRSWASDLPESMRVMIGTSASPGDFETELIDLGSFAMDEYETENVLFAVPEDGTYFVAFHVYSPEDHRFVYLDNVFLERMVYADIAPTEIDVIAEGCDFSVETPVDVSFKNFGMDAQQGFDVELQIKHIASETESTLTTAYDQVLEPEQTAYHTFLADLSLHGAYEIKLITLLEGDENPNNDTLTIHTNNTSINVSEENYFTSFDDVFSLEELGWSTHSNSADGVGWRFHTLSGQAHTPPHSINMYRQAGNPDDWVFTNCMMMEEDKWYRISFYTATKGTNSEEYFSIHLLDEPFPENEIGMIGELFVRTFDYVNEEIIFQAPYTGNFHIGLFTDFVGPNTFQIFVDDFGVESVLQHDAAAVDVIQQSFGCNSFTEETPIKVVIQNKGYDLLVNPEVLLHVEDEAGISETYSLYSSQSLSIAETDTLQFYVDMSQLNTIYTLTGEVLLENDEDVSNNTYSTEVRNTTVDLTAGQVYFTDFEMVTIDGHSSLVQPQTGWWYENTNNDYSSDSSPITWVMRKNAPFALSGEIAMRSGRSLDEPADDWLFSNCFIMQEGINYMLEFYYTGRTASATENMSVYLGDAQESGSMEQFLWTDEFSTGLNYQRAVAAFSPPADGIYYIGFHAHSDADEGWIYMDDVSVQKNYDIDITLDQIEIMEDACGFSEHTPVRIHYRNSGNVAINDVFTLAFEVISPNGDVIGSDEIAIENSLQVNETAVFDVVADLRYFGKYIINAEISLPEELVEPETDNNTGSIEVFSTSLNPDAEDVYISFEQFFDISETGWTAIDVNNDGFTWDLGTDYTSYAYSGSHMMFYTFSQNNDANDWLFSSCANLEAGTIYVASFYYRVFQGDFAENMRFVIADAPNQNAIIQELDVIEDMNNATYRKVDYVFSLEETGQYFFGIQAFSEKLKRYIFIDDFILRQAADYDAVVYSVQADTDACSFDNETPVRLSVKNLGTTALPAGELEINMSGPGDPQSFTQNIPAIDVLGNTDVFFEVDITETGRYTVNYSLTVSDGEIDVSDSGSEYIFAWRHKLAEPGKWHVQSFEQVAALYETGWSSHNLNNDNRYWGLRVNDPFFALSGSNYLVYFTGNTNMSANDWAISGCYELEGGRKYKAAFYYLLGSGSHNLLLALGDEPLPHKMSEMIWEDTGLVDGGNAEYQQTEGVFEMPQSGTYYFGIKQNSTAGQGSSIIDDFVVIAQPEIHQLDGLVDPGQEIVVTALGSDSLQWFSDPELTNLIAAGTTLNYTITEDHNFRLYAAEAVQGFIGPADTLFVNLFEEYMLSLHAEPEEGGDVFGAGSFVEGEEVTVSAEANDGFLFSHWQDSGGTTSDQPGFTFFMPGEAYSLTAVFVPDDTSTPDIQERHVNIFPNPASDHVNIISSDRIHRIVITGMQGTVVKRLPVDGFQTTLTTSDLTPGIYIVKVYSDMGVYTGKLDVRR